MSSVDPDSSTTLRLLDRINEGDESAYAPLLQRYRAYLRRVIRMRLDRRILSRIDPSDIVQETQIEVVRRLPDYLKRKPMPFQLWIRKTAEERLMMAHRFHLRSARRSVDREATLPTESSLRLADAIIDPRSSPSRTYDNREYARLVRQIVDQLPEHYQQVLVMRNLEHLTNDQVSQVLGIPTATASQRYGRALLRLRTLLKDAGLFDD